DVCSSDLSSADVGQEGHLTGVLDRRGHLALALGAETGDTTATDLAAVGQVLAEGRGVLPIDGALGAHLARPVLRPAAKVLTPAAGGHRVPVVLTSQLSHS